MKGVTIGAGGVEGSGRSGFSPFGIWLAAFLFLCQVGGRPTLDHPFEPEMVPGGKLRRKDRFRQRPLVSRGIERYSIAHLKSLAGHLRRALPHGLPQFPILDQPLLTCRKGSDILERSE